jgi:DNA-binding CsgD family transcriptional regulator
MAAEGWCRRAEALLRGLGMQVPSRRSGRGAGGLTVRELEVLRLVAKGASNQEIAQLLFISKPTAVRHVANIFRKLGVKNRAEAVRVASERGLFEARD